MVPEIIKSIVFIADLDSDIITKINEKAIKESKSKDEIVESVLSKHFREDEIEGALLKTTYIKIAFSEKGREKLEEIFLYGDSIPLYLDKRSETLKLIQNLRNEAHRFSLKHHRNKRGSSFLTNELEQIKGVGEKTILDLLRHFKSNRNISTAKIKDLKKIIGDKRALLIYNYYKSR